MLLHCLLHSECSQLQYQQKDPCPAADYYLFGRCDFSEGTLIVPYKNVSIQD